MRNLRKLTAVVIAVALVLTSMTAAFAASGSYEFEDQATVLKDLGIWQGNTAGDLMLGEKLTRAQGAVLVLKTVLGKTDKDMEAADVSAIAKYTDASEVPAWAEGWVALAVKEGVMKGGNNKLAAGDELKGKDLASMFMNALGFAAENEYATAVEKLAAKSAGKILAGIADDITDADLTRDAASAVVFDTLTVKAKDAAKTVVEVLVGTDATKKAVAEKAGLIVAPAAQTVTSVKALNLVQVQITFAKEVAKADAEKKENYVVTEENSTINKIANGSAAVQADGKTVILTLDQKVNNGKNAVIEVKNFVTYKSDAVKFEDTTVPTILGVTVTGPRTIAAEFSEPVTFAKAIPEGANDFISNSEVKIDGSNYLVRTVSIDKNKVSIEVGVKFTEGAHKISFESQGQLFDYAGYKVLPRTVDFTVTDDKAAPVLTLKSAEPNKVVLTSNKPLDPTTVANANVKYRHTYNSDTYSFAGDSKDKDGVARVKLANGDTEITINFTGSAVPLGANNLYIEYTDKAGTKITDLWGNSLPATAIPMNITLDTVKPTVTEVKFDSPTSLIVVFSKALEDASAKTSTNYVLKDSAGKVLTVSDPQFTDDTKTKVKITTDIMNGGTYSIEIKGVKDGSFLTNAMEAYTATLNFTDKVAPDVQVDKDKKTKARVVISTGSDGVALRKASIYIPFTEQMDPTSLVKANFMKKVGTKFVALEDKDTVTVAPDAKSVTIVLDKAENDFVDGSVIIRVGLVKDIAGNALASYIQDVTPEKDVLNVLTVEAIAKNQIKVTFDGRINEGTISPAGFALKNGATPAAEIQMSGVSRSVNADGNSEVIFSLGKDLNDDTSYAEFATTIAVTKATAKITSYLGATVEDYTAKALTDKIVPSAPAVKVTDDTTIEVTFKEKIKASTLAATLNGFSVSGGDVALKSVAMKVANTDGTVIVLKAADGKKFTAESTVVKYNSVAGITDMNDNKVADFEKTTTK